jgi:2-(1,2-epoxy-1,2-dihydrophenyl)acetyl-CoA isomerase
MGYAKLLYDLTDGVARIALNDPATLNAATEEMGAELLDALNRAAREARAVLLTGEGRAFCSGANLADAQALLDDPMRDGGEQLERAFNPAILAMRDMEQPIVTAVPGVAAGVGCGIALAGDVILCAESAYFFFAFRHVGLVPDGGSSWLLARAVGRVRATRLMLLGEKIGAAEALDWGLVSRVLPDAELPAAARELTASLAAGPKCLGMIKRLAWDAADSDLDTALQNERRLQCDASRTEDFVEGVKAFAERRKPRFKGR